MELVEVYRGVNIMRGLKNSRQMYVIPGASTFTLDSARKSVDRMHWSRQSTILSLGLNLVANVSYYTPDTYVMGLAYQNLSNIRLISKTWGPILKISVL